MSDRLTRYRTVAGDLGWFNPAEAKRFPLFGTPIASAAMLFDVYLTHSKWIVNTSAIYHSGRWDHEPHEHKRSYKDIKNGIEHWEISPAEALDLFDRLRLEPPVELVTLLCDSDLAPEAPQAPQSDPREETANPPVRATKRPTQSRLKRGDASAMIVSTLLNLAKDGRWNETQDKIIELTRVPRSTYFDTVRKDKDAGRAKREYDSRKLGCGVARPDDF